MARPSRRVAACPSPRGARVGLLPRGRGLRARCHSTRLSPRRLLSRAADSGRLRVPRTLRGRSGHALPDPDRGRHGGTAADRRRGAHARSVRLFRGHQPHLVRAPAASGRACVSTGGAAGRARRGDCRHHRTVQQPRRPRRGGAVHGRACRRPGRRRRRHPSAPAGGRVDGACRVRPGRRRSRHAVTVRGLRARHRGARERRAGARGRHGQGRARPRRRRRSARPGEAARRAAACFRAGPRRHRAESPRGCRTPDAGAAALRLRGGRPRRRRHRQRSPA